jgi:hypothetical protein
MVGGMGTRIQAVLERSFSHPGRLYIGFPYIIRLHRVSLRCRLHGVFLYNTIR